MWTLPHLRPAKPTRDPRFCAHLRHVPAFDPGQRALPPEAVRQLFPRFAGECEDCGATAIVYACEEHRQAGEPWR